MAVVVTFDPINLIIQEVNTGLDVNETDQAEIYSEWKDWILADAATRLGYPQAFRVVGSDPISDIQNLGTSYFLGGGWKFRPAEYDHQWIINGNIFTDPAGERRTTPTLGNYTVEVTFFVSNLVDSSVARLDLAALQEAVYIDTTFGTGGTDEGIGTPTNPSSNIADAYTIATRDKLRAFSINGAVTLDQPYSDWKFIGTTSREAAHVDFGSQSTARCLFEDVALDGNAANSILTARSCTIEGVTNALGTFRFCGLTSLFTPGAAGLLTLEKCFSDVPGTGKPVLDLANNLSDNAQVRGWHGGLELRNVDVPGQLVSLDIDSGDVLIDPTCIEGIIIVRGPCSFTDNSGPNCTIVDKTTPRAVWDTVVA